MLLDPELIEIQRKTGYKCNIPRDFSEIHFLEVIKPLVWSGNVGIIDPNKIPVGSLTWSYSFSGSTVHPEDNKLGANVKSTCFRLIKSVNAISDFEQKITEDKGSFKFAKYRFKTREEFISDRKWLEREGLHVDGTPLHWSSFGEMNHYLGKKVSLEGQEAIENYLEEKSSRISFDGWSFKEWNFIEANVIPPPATSPVKGKIQYGMQAPEEIGDKLTVNQESGVLLDKVIDDWESVAKKPSLSPTSQETKSIEYPKPEKALDDDFVIESTINITI